MRPADSWRCTEQGEVGKAGKAQGARERHRPIGTEKAIFQIICLLVPSPFLYSLANHSWQHHDGSGIMASEYKLTDTQLHALLDILSHQEVYSEIEDFRFPGALSAYGPPFESKAALPSSSPALQALISRFVLKLPGLQDVSDDFWQQQLHSIIEDFEKAELSESYDKGHLGIRKTLATAISALMEYPVRGILAGFDEPQASAYDQTYNIKDARDLQRAFKDLMHQVVYGDVLDSMFRRTAQTDKLTDHEPIVQAAHEFGLVK